MALQNISLSFPSDGYFGLPQHLSDSSISPLAFDEVPHLPPKLYSTAGGNERVARGPYQQQIPELQPFHQTSQRRQPYGRQGTHYTKVDSAPSPNNGKTSVHAVLDYDDDFGDEMNYNYNQLPQTNYHLPASVTPIQGPIFVKNGSVPVVPLYSYPKVNNGTFIQIPIMWAALSLALGYEVRGDYIRGAPCIKRNHQLFCPTAGNSYPIDRIEKFIDDNKALMRRMYGEFESSNVDYGPTDTDRRHARTYQSSSYYREDSSYYSKTHSKRQTNTIPKEPPSTSGRVDSCESKLEVITPYWASNSAGKVRAIVNTQHFEQAIHQEVCSKSETKRCANDCRCEQKYKWHRLLAYDPSNDCKGIFMDWFLFPSCCVCRCAPN